MKKFFLSFVMLLSGCASNGYSEFYTQRLSDDQIKSLALLNDGQTPKVVHVNDLKDAIRTARAKGYVPFGEANFNGPAASDSQLTVQAKKVGAQLVLASSSFSETRVINSTYSVPTTSTTFNSGTVRNGYGAATYSGTSTTYGTQVIPYSASVDRYDHSAIFLALTKVKPKFGVWLVDLTPEMKRRIESNFGVMVDVVREGSPAFNANILEGDILLSLNGTPLASEATAGQVLRDAQPVDGKYRFRLFRNGQIREVDVIPQ